MVRSKASIAFRVAIALVTVTTLALGIFVWLSYRGEQRLQIAHLRLVHSNTADQMAVSLALPVWNFDRDQIDKIIESAMRDQNIFAVVVRLVDVNATIHARARDEQWNIKPVNQEPSIDGLLLVETRNITGGGDILGTVKVFVTTRFTEAELKKTLGLMILTIVIFDALLIFCLYFLLWRVVLKPLKILERHAVAVSAGGGEDTTLQKSRFYGELESLRTSLEKMICLLKSRYQELRESEEQFRAVVEFSPECVAVAVEERLVYLNPAGAKLIGVEDSAKMIGRSIFDFAPVELHKEVRERRRAVLTSGVATSLIVGQLVRPDSTTIFVEGIAVPFVYRGKPAILNLIRDITERQRAEEERTQVAAREQKALKEFAQQLIVSQETERRRIAGELHDSLGQNLSIIKNRTQLALKKEPVSSDSRAQLEAINELVSQAIVEVRQISRDLHPYQIEHLGLTRAIEAMIDTTAAASGIIFQHKFDIVDECFSAEAAMNFYRIIQESLNNILKHSGAKQARIGLERDVHEIQLQIEDDGCGFNVSDDKVEKGLGLRNIAERVRILHGQLKVDSQPSRGTRIEVIIPITEDKC